MEGVREREIRATTRHARLGRCFALWAVVLLSPEEQEEPMNTIRREAATHTIRGHEEQIVCQPSFIHIRCLHERPIGCVCVCQARKMRVEGKKHRLDDQSACCCSASEEGRLLGGSLCLSHQPRGLPAIHAHTCTLGVLQRGQPKAARNTILRHPRHS